MVNSVWWSLFGEFHRIPRDSTVFTLEQEVSPTCSFFLRVSVEFTTGFTFEQALSQPTSGFFLWVSVVNSMGFKVPFSYEYPWDSPLSKRRQLFLMSFLGFPGKLHRLLTRTALKQPTHLLKAKHHYRPYLSAWLEKLPSCFDEKTSSIAIIFW